MFSYKTKGSISVEFNVI